MPVPAYTAEDLTVFSTIIARAACMRGWDADLGQGAPAAIQEVQCMQLGDALYFAGNGIEHMAIASYFRAFGVSDHTSLINCLKYSHWLLSTPAHQRSAVVGRAFTGGYSPQETATMNYAAASLVAHIPALSAQEITDARGLVTTAALPAAPVRGLAWCLRKFAGAAAIAGLNRPAATLFNYPVNYNGLHEINLLNDSTNVHAELKLLRLLTYTRTQNLLHGTASDARVGGLKRTCAFCAAWINRFRPWIGLQYRITLTLPANDTRAMGGGAGDRPSGVGEAGFGNYVQALFNGGANSLCVDVAAHSNDAEW
jgi:hypothetical protein